MWNMKSYKSFYYRIISIILFLLEKKLKLKKKVENVEVVYKRNHKKIV